MILQDNKKFKHFCYFSIDMKTGLTLAYLRTICGSLKTLGIFFVFLKGGVWIFWWSRAGLLWKGGVRNGVSRFRVGLVAKGGGLFSRVGYQPRRKVCIYRFTRIASSQVHSSNFPIKCYKISRFSQGTERHWSLNFNQ